MSGVHATPRTPGRTGLRRPASCPGLRNLAPFCAERLLPVLRHRFVDEALRRQDRDVVPIDPAPRELVVVLRIPRVGAWNRFALGRRVRPGVVRDSFSPRRRRRVSTPPCRDCGWLVVRARPHTSHSLGSLRSLGNGRARVSPSVLEPARGAASCGVFRPRCRAFPACRAQRSAYEPAWRMPCSIRRPLISLFVFGRGWR